MWILSVPLARILIYAVQRAHQSAQTSYGNVGLSLNGCLVLMIWPRREWPSVPAPLAVPPNAARLANGHWGSKHSQAKYIVLHWCWRNNHTHWMAKNCDSIYLMLEPFLLLQPRQRPQLRRKNRSDTGWRRTNKQTNKKKRNRGFVFGPLLFSAIIGIAVNANAITIRFYSPERVIMYVVFSYYIFLYIFHLIRSLDASQNRKKNKVMSLQ